MTRFAGHEVLQILGDRHATPEPTPSSRDTDSPHAVRRSGISLALVALVALVHLPPTSRADSPTDVLDTLVVTGTRGERRLLDTPVRTEVITRDELDRTHARDVAEALRHRPGLLLRDIHGKAGTEVWMQGLDSDRVLVLLDGRPVSASTGSTVDLTQITAAEVERIEVVKGAASALYGSAAMGGVVNVITREAEALLATRLTLDSGSHGERGLGAALGERHVAASANARRGALDARFSVDARDGDGFDLDDDTYAFEGARGTRFDVVGELGLDIGRRDRLRFRSAWYDEDVERDFSTFAPGVGEIEKLDGERVGRLTQTLDWRRDLGAGRTLKGWVQFERFEDETVQDIVATGELDQRREASLASTRADLQYDRPLGSSQVLTVGVSASDVSLEQDLARSGANGTDVVDEIEPGAGRRNVELFVQDDIFVGERWELVPGVRVQDDSDFGSHVAPKLNVLYEPTRLVRWNPRLRAGIGTGYRVPNLKERHYLFDHSALGYVVLGDPTLDPESSLSLQLGAEFSNATSTRFDISLFHNRFDDLIATARDAESSDEAGIEVFRYGNVEDARTRGLETSVAHAFSEALTLSGAWTLLDATDLGTGRRLTRRPRHQVQLGADVGAGRTTLAVRTTWQSEEYVDAANEIESPSHLALALKLNRAVTSRLALFAGVDNLTDEHRDPDSPGLDLRPERGRFVYAGLRYAFSSDDTSPGRPE